MKKGQKLWTREESILAVNLYCKLPFGKMHKGTPEIISLAKLINRTPDSIAFKLGNFASFDPSLQARGIKGASNTSKLDKKIWDEFYQNWDQAVIESEKLLAEISGNVEPEIIEDFDFTGLTVERKILARVKQSFFRSTVLASYNFKCCVTGIENPEFLIAGHILPWSLDQKNRLNPRNGLCLNALHDRAFESGHLTITPEYKILISKALKSKSKTGSNQDFFLKYDGREIILPSKFLPDPEFLNYHNNERFKG